MNCFDEKFYLNKYPDVKSDALNHFMMCGRFEGRRINKMIFDEKFYLNQYSDIKNAFKSNTIKSGYEHYIFHGYKEGRKVNWLEPNLKKEPKFIIYTPAFSFGCGGCVALHKLGDILNHAGENAWIWLQSENYNQCNYYSLPIANGIISTKDSIAIYPDIIHDNPLGAKIVVRWFLGGPRDIPKTWKDDILITYSKWFCDTALVLWAYDVFKEYFYDLGKPRSGSCFTIRKALNKKRIKHIEQFELLRDYSIQYLFTLFNEKETFYSYDIKTGLNLIAAMCGCTSVIIPNEDLSKDDFMKLNPMSKYGIAYGLENIEWAKETKHLVTKHLEDLEQENKNNVIKFIDIVKSKL